MGLFEPPFESKLFHFHEDFSEGLGKLIKLNSLLTSPGSIPAVLHRNFKQSEPRHDKTNKVSVHPAKTQISLGIRSV